MKEQQLGLVRPVEIDLDTELGFLKKHLRHSTPPELPYKTQKTQVYRWFDTESVMLCTGEMASFEANMTDDPATVARSRHRQRCSVAAATDQPGR